MVSLSSDTNIREHTATFFNIIKSSKIDKDQSIYGRKSLGNNIKDLTKYLPGKKASIYEKMDPSIWRKGSWWISLWRRLKPRSIKINLDN